MNAAIILATKTIALKSHRPAIGQRRKILKKNLRRLGTEIDNQGGPGNANRRTLGQSSASAITSPAFCFAAPACPVDRPRSQLQEYVNQAFVLRFRARAFFLGFSSFALSAVAKALSAQCRNSPGSSYRRSGRRQYGMMCGLLFPS